jgi:hypothetical protein
MAFGLALAGCSQVAEKAENAASRSFTSYAMGRPYAEVGGGPTLSTPTTPYNAVGAVFLVAAVCRAGTARRLLGSGPINSV